MATEREIKTQIIEKETRKCSNCVFCSSVEGIMTDTGLVCENQDNKFYPGGIPEKGVCERHRFKSGIKVREKVGEENIPGLWLIQKSKGWSREIFEMFLEEDSAKFESCTGW